MEAKDFRIGNLISVDDRIVSISKLGEEHFSFLLPTSNNRKIWNPYLSFNDKRVKPIELTEEWLKNIEGIKYYSSEYYIPLPNLKIEIHFVWYMEKWLVEIHNHVIPIVTGIEYVHQLQNLVYAISGSELTINEQK